MSEPDLLHHYKVLKQFLDILDDLGSRTKLNLLRAMRAREKLLKLLGAQFRELSTDVYDELKRRIDESQAEPDFLLLKLTFHPKRNQARQKLSLLPQTRFKDLVLDISYEISRRNLHIPPEKQARSSDTASVSDRDIRRSQDTEPSVPSAPSVRSDHHSLRPENPDLSRLLEAPEANSTAQDPDILQLSHDESKQTIAVQPTTVIPTKANLTWSSDEEEEEGDDHRGIKGAAAGLGVGAVAGAAGKSLLPSSDNSKDMEDLKLKLRDAEERAAELEKANEELKTNLAATLSQKDTLEAENKQHLAKSTDPKELNALRDEIESLKSSSAALRLENQALKNKNWKESRQSRDLAALSRENSLSSHLATLPGQQSSRPQSGTLNQAVAFASASSPNQSPSRNIASTSTNLDVNNELKKLHEKMAAFDSPQNTPAVSKRELLLKAEAAQWQQRYQDVQTGIIKKNLLSKQPELQKYVSPSGLIPTQTASEFFAAIEAFMISLYDDHSDSELLFEKISNLAILANKLASVGDKSALYENDHLAVNVREAAGHSLTATRYYSSNKKTLPRVVVERSVDELAFTVCDLVSTCKLNVGSASQEQPQSIPDLTQDSNDAIRPLKIGRSTNLSPPDNKNNISRGLSPVEGFSTPRLRTMSTEALKHQDEEPVDSPSPSPSKILPGSLPLSDPVELQEAAKEEPAKEEPVKKLTMFERLSGTRKKAEPVASEAAPEATTESTSEANKSVDNGSANGVVGAAGGAAIGAAAAAAAAVTGSKEPDSKDRSLTESNTSAKSDSTTDKRAAEPSVVGRSPSQNKENLAPSTPHSASRTNILDKVRQFESPEESPSNRLISKTKSPSLVSVKDAKEIFSKGGAESASPSQLSPIASKSNDNTPTRSRSLFQTLRNRFAGETKTEEGEPLESKESPVLAAKAAVSGVNGHNDQGSELKETVTKAAVGAAAGAATYVGANKVADKIKNLEEEQVDTDDLNQDPVEMSLDTPQIQTSNQPVEPLVTRAESNLDRKLDDKPDTKSIDADEEPGLKPKPSLKALSGKLPSFKVKKVNYAEKQEEREESEESEEDSDYDEQEEEARQRQEYRKSMAAATFNFDLFDIDDPDNTLTQVLLYLEHQTVQVISTIQDLLTAIKKPDATRGELRENSKAISEVIRLMAEATKTSMNQTRNHQLKEHGSWVVTSLEDCNHRMNNLCRPDADENDEKFADKNFKQRLAGISFDIAKCTKELVKTVEEASLKEDIAQLDARLNQPDDDLT